VGVNGNPRCRVTAVIADGIECGPGGALTRLQPRLRRHELQTKGGIPTPEHSSDLLAVSCHCMAQKWDSQTG